MKYFVIHSGSDYATVHNLISEWTEEFDTIQFIVLEGNQENWEGDATARIRESGKVLYIVGERSHESPYIQKELDIAKRENKEIYVYKLNESNKINESLIKFRKKENASNGELEGEIVFSKTKEKVLLLNKTELDKRMSIDSQEIESILKGGAFEDKEVLLQQYQMFVRTSEDLVSRKQSVNTFYITLNSLMLSAIISVICAAGELLEISGESIVVYLISAFLAIIGIVICCSWITLLNSYSDLNASKMAIIGCVEERLALKLFDTEWAVLTRRIGDKTYKSFTVKEIAVAKIFLFLYAIILLVSVIVCFIR